MTRTKTMTLVAFASLGLNVFFGGILVGKMLRPEAPGAATTETSVRPGNAAPGPKDMEMGKTPPSDREHANHERHASRAQHPPRGERGERGDGPSDLALLRRMVRIMGGPKDPRIARLREERKDEIQRIRTEMAAAHRRVHEALTSEKPDDMELREALKNLRKTAFEAQARAQEGILTLAALMTEEERARLRSQRREQRRDKSTSPPHVDGGAP